jgi:NADPH:quinone reductase-like Zn-dependent oxidoreductase
MKAATYKRFGDHNVIEIEEAKKPKIGSEEILVNVHASSSEVSRSPKLPKR